MGCLRLVSTDTKAIQPAMAAATPARMASACHPNFAPSIKTATDAPSATMASNCPAMSNGLPAPPGRTDSTRVVNQAPSNAMGTFTRKMLRQPSR